MLPILTIEIGQLFASVLMNVVQQRASFIYIQGLTKPLEAHYLEFYFKATMLQSAPIRDRIIG